MFNFNYILVRLNFKFEGGVDLPEEELEAYSETQYQIYVWLVFGAVFLYLVRAVFYNFLINRLFYPTPNL